VIDRNGWSRSVGTSGHDRRSAHCTRLSCLACSPWLGPVGTVYDR
jgi:hypothetical protein